MFDELSLCPKKLKLSFNLSVTKFVRTFNNLVALLKSGYDVEQTEVRSKSDLSSTTKYDQNNICDSYEFCNT